MPPFPSPGSPPSLSLAGGMKQWKMVSLLVALPAIGLCMVNAFTAEHEHPPEFVQYDYLRIRTKVVGMGRDEVMGGRGRVKIEGDVEMISM